MQMCVFVTLREAIKKQKRSQEVKDGWEKQQWWEAKWQQESEVNQRKQQGDADRAG